MYTLLLCLVYLAFVSLGLPDSLLGSGWPVMHLELGVPVSFMGILSTVVSLCTILSSLFSNRLTRRFGTAGVTVASVFLTAVALLGYSVSPDFTMLLLFAIPYGLGAGAIDAALNNFVAQHYSSRHMSWLHCFWGVGTIVSPFVMSYALTLGAWNLGYRIVGFLQLGIALVLLLTLPVWKKVPQAEQQSQRSVGILETLKIRGVPSLLLGFFAYCAIEATAMNWASTYFVSARAISPEQAARFASLCYIGITAGRFLGGFVMNRLGDRRMILLGASILSCGCILLLIPGGTALAFAGFLVIGFGCAPVYPCIIHATPYNFGPENAAAIIGIQMAFAYLGSTIMPLVFGVLGRIAGFWILPLYLLIFVVLMVSMTERTFRITGKTK